MFSSPKKIYNRTAKVPTSETIHNHTHSHKIHHIHMICVIAASEMRKCETRIRTHLEEMKGKYWNTCCNKFKKKK